MMIVSSLNSHVSQQSLPNELLLHILDYVDYFDHSSRSTTLYGVNLSNRRLYGLTKPYLYSTISFHAGVPYLFLRSISQNPALAYHVKKIQWDYDTEAAETFNYKSGVLAVKQKFEIDEVQAKLTESAAGGDNLAAWMLKELEFGRLYLGDLRALYLLLMFAPNVEHLGVVETYRWDDHSYWFMPLGFSNTDALSRLTSATLNGPLRLQNITSLITLPSMRRLELSQVVEMRQEPDRAFDWESQDINMPWKRILNKSKSNIELFHLYESYIDAKDLKIVVRAMRGSQSFVY